MCLRNLAVVGDLHEVVKLGAVADDGRLKGAAVDGAAGADLDIVADDDVAKLRHLHVSALEEAIAEPIGAEDCVGMNDDAIAKDRAVVEDGVWIEHDIVAEPAVFADDGAGVQQAAFANDGISANDSRRHGWRRRCRCGALGRRGPGFAESMPVGCGAVLPCRCWKTAANAMRGSTMRNYAALPLKNQIKRDNGCRRARRLCQPRDAAILVEKSDVAPVAPPEAGVLHEQSGRRRLPECREPTLLPVAEG